LWLKQSIFVSIASNHNQIICYFLILQESFEQWRNGILDNALDSAGSAIDVVCSQS
jgi:hypothetical protein